MFFFPLPEETDLKKEKITKAVQSVLYMISSRNFIVSGLIFMPLIHYTFIFVYGMRGNVLI